MTPNFMAMAKFSLVAIGSHCRNPTNGQNFYIDSHWQPFVLLVLVDTPPSKSLVIKRWLQIPL
jgi:hypothetical protein